MPYVHPVDPNIESYQIGRIESVFVDSLGISEHNA